MFRKQYTRSFFYAVKRYDFVVQLSSTLHQNSEFQRLRIIGQKPNKIFVRGVWLERKWMVDLLDRDLDGRGTMVRVTLNERDQDRADGMIGYFHDHVLKPFADQETDHHGMALARRVERTTPSSSTPPASNQSVARADCPACGLPVFADADVCWNCASRYPAGTREAFKDEAARLAYHKEYLYDIAYVPVIGAMAEGRLLEDEAGVIADLILKRVEAAQDDADLLQFAHELAAKWPILEPVDRFANVQLSPGMKLLTGAPLAGSELAEIGERLNLARAAVQADAARRYAEELHRLGIAPDAHDQAQPDVDDTQNAPTVFCIHCGTVLPAEARFCSSCGKPVSG